MFSAAPWAAALIVVCLVAAGCGSDSSSSPTDTSGSGGSAGSSNTGSAGPKLTKSPIVIGFANASTGAADGAQERPNEDIVKAWVKWVNTDQGGINGHPVKVIMKDTKDEPSAAASGAQQLIRSKVVAEVAGTDTVTAQVWVKALNAAKIPVIGGELIDHDLITTQPYYFPIVLDVLNYIPLVANQVQVAGAKSVGVVLCSESPSCGGAADLLKPQVKKLGLTFAGTAGVRASQPNYTAACLSMQQSKADAVWLALPNSTTVRVLSDCQKQGTKFKTYIGGGSGFSGKTLVPLSKQGVTFQEGSDGFPWWLDTPATKQFRNVMAKFGGDDIYYENPVHTIAWASLELFRKAMAHASDNVTSTEVANAMWSLKDEDLGGLLPQKITYNRNKPSTPLHCMWTTTLANGDYTNTKKICLTPPAA